MSLSQQITEAEVSKIVGRPEIDYYTVDAAGAITHYRWDGAKMAPLLSAPAVAAVNAGSLIAPVVADGVTDDAAALQAGLAQFSEAARGVYIFPKNRTIKLNSGLSFRAGTVSLDLNGSTLDFSGMTSGYAITILPPLDPYGEIVNTRDVLMNGYINGPIADATLVDGVKIDRLTALTGVISGMSWRNVIIKGFRDGVFYDRGSYINHFFNVSVIGARRWGINYPGLEYSGENWSWFGGRIADCHNASNTAAAIYMPAGGINQLHLFGTSLDYNDIQGVIQSGRIKVFGGNVENNKTAAQWQLDATGAGDWIELDLACDTSMTEAVPGRASYITVNGDRAFVDVSRLHMYAYQMTTEVVNVTGGKPRVNYKGIHLLATGGSAQQPNISNYCNMVYQGQDAGTPLTAPWVASSGNVAVSVGTGFGNGGGNSIRGIWTGSASADFYYELAVNPGEIALVEAQVKITALASGSVYLRIRFVDSLGNLIQNNDQVSWSATGAFQKVSSWYRCPAGASRVRIDFWNGANTATVDVDDVKAWII
jgi:hypothetical protein